MSLAAAVAAIILSSIAAVFICGALYLYLVSVAAAPALAALLVGLATMTAVGSIILALAIMSQRRAHDRRICAVPTPVGQPTMWRQISAAWRAANLHCWHRRIPITHLF